MRFILIFISTLLLSACGGGSGVIDLGGETSDTTTPVIAITGIDVSIEVGTAYIDAGATALDEVDGEITVSDVSTVDTNTVGSYTVTYTATDSSDNSSTAVRNVIVTQVSNTIDTTSPVITITGTDVSIEVGTAYIDAGATALDEVDGEITVNDVSTVDTNTVGSYTVTYTATDNSGNTATAVRNVNTREVVDVGEGTLIFEEGFESYDNGSYPDLWNYFVAYQADLGYSPATYLDRIKVQNVDVNSGSQALNLSNDYGANEPVQVAYELDPSKFDDTVYVRMYMKQSVDIGRSVGNNHATLVALRGSSGSNDIEVRFGDAKGVLGINVNPTDGIAPVYEEQASQLSASELDAAPQIDKDEWHCLELAFLDEGEQSQMFVWNNDDLVFSVESPADFAPGGPTDVHWLAPFMRPENGNVEIVIGWQSWGAGTNESILVDDVVASTERIGCDL